MTIYETNMNILKQYHFDIYEGIGKNSGSDQIMVGDAYNGGRFLAISDGYNVIALSSMYNPQHAADRYMIPFEKLPDSTTLFLFGFGDGEVVRRVLVDHCPVHQCIVYEPSMDIFLATVSNYDLQDLLCSDKLRIIVSGINQDQTEMILNEYVNFMNWPTFAIASLPVYSRIFSEEYEQCCTWYQDCILSCQGIRNASMVFAKSGLRNEINAQRWLIDSYAVDDMVGSFPKELPCILVASGPSLEKNVQYLQRAKGKACIMAVDSAMKYLLDHGIMPDFTCTIDADKSAAYFDDDRMKGIPVFLTTVSNSLMLETLSDFVPIYFNNSIDYYNRLIGKAGHSFLDFDGGGSVATFLFRLALELKFRTIILIGQDLAYTNLQSHADTDKVTEVEITRYSMYEVEGYYGETVYTPGDLKIYLDWYRRIIPMYADDRTIINATEGGAKIAGAIQMPFSEAIDRYCVSEYDCADIYKNRPRIWNTLEEKKEYYQYLVNGMRSLKNVRRILSEAIHQIERIFVLLNRNNYSESEFMEIESKVDRMISEIFNSELYEMLNERAAVSNIAMSDGLDENSDDLNDERIHLYKITYDHLQELTTAVEEAIPLWEHSLGELDSIYHFAE